MNKADLIFGGSSFAVSHLARAITRVGRHILLNGANSKHYTLQQVTVTMFVKPFTGTKIHIVSRVFINATTDVSDRVQSLNIGYHLVRVTKLLQSTDILSASLTLCGLQFRGSPGKVMERPKADTLGTFI